MKPVREVPDYVVVALHASGASYRVREARDLTHVNEMLSRYQQREGVVGVAAFQTKFLQPGTDPIPFVDLRLLGGVWVDRCSAAWSILKGALNA